jgi:hypothetical protein
MKKQKKRDNIFNKRMQDLGYDDVTEWKRKSKVLLSFETCRRAIYEFSQSIRHDYIVRLMLVLDFTLPEIKEELLRRGDKYLHRLISDSSKGVLLNDQEKFIIEKLRKQTDLVPIVTTIVGLRDLKK